MTRFDSEAAAALVFLVLYSVPFAVFVWGYATRYFKWKSPYTILAVHVTFRLAAQATGLAFGLKYSYGAVGLLVAYFVLGIEGYLTLVLCAYRFLIVFQQIHLPSRTSWLEARRNKSDTVRQRFFSAFSLRDKERRSPMVGIHYALIAANALIITGGNFMSAEVNASYVGDREASFRKGKRLRVAGQAIFLAITVFLLYATVRTLSQLRRSCPEERRQPMHPTIKILLVTWPFLFVRGLYGVLTPVVAILNYYNVTNYGPNGLNTPFIVAEYLLQTTMEFIACCLLMSTRRTSEDEHELVDPNEAERERALDDKENHVKEKSPA